MDVLDSLTASLQRCHMCQTKVKSTDMFRHKFDHASIWPTFMQNWGCPCGSGALRCEFACATIEELINHLECQHSCAPEIGHYGDYDDRRAHGTYGDSESDEIEEGDGPGPLFGDDSSDFPAWGMKHRFHPPESTLSCSSPLLPWKDELEGNSEDGEHRSEDGSGSRPFSPLPVPSKYRRGSLEDTRFLPPGHPLAPTSPPDSSPYHSDYQADVNAPAWDGEWELRSSPERDQSPIPRGGSPAAESSPPRSSSYRVDHARLNVVSATRDGQPSNGVRADMSYLGSGYPEGSLTLSRRDNSSAAHHDEDIDHDICEISMESSNSQESAPDAKDISMGAEMEANSNANPNGDAFPSQDHSGSSEADSSVFKAEDSVDMFLYDTVNHTASASPRELARRRRQDPYSSDLSYELPQDSGPDAADFDSGSATARSSS